MIIAVEREADKCEGCGVVDLYWINLNLDYISESPFLYSFPVLATRDMLHIWKAQGKQVLGKLA